MDANEPVAQLGKLTERQIEILRLVCQGLDYRTIAGRLYVAESTVKAHMANIYVRLELDQLSRTPRRKRLFEVYCPALRGWEGSAGGQGEDGDSRSQSKQDEDSEPDLESVPGSVLDMVEDDERALVVREPRPPIVISHPEPARPRQHGRPYLLWLGLVVGAVLTVGILYAAGAFSPRDQEVLVVTATLPPQATARNTVAPTSTQAVPTPQKSQATSTVTAATPTFSPAPTFTPQPTPTPTPIPVREVALPFEDNFENGLKPEWRVLSGDWRITGGRLTSLPNGRWSYLLVGDLTWQNYAVEFDFEKGAPLRIAVLTRVQDLDNCVKFELELDDSYWKLRRGGQDLLLVEGPGTYWHKPSNRRGHLKVEANGHFYRVYYDDELWLDITDDSFSSGQVGLGMYCDDEYSNCHTFDNVRITELDR